MDEDEFNIPYIIDNIPNSQPGHQITTQAKNKLWIIDINGEYPKTAKGSLGKLKHY